MAWANTTWSDKVKEILDAPTYDDQMKLALKYISHLEGEIYELQNEVKKQKALATKYRDAVNNIDLSQHVLQFNAEEFLAWASIMAFALAKRNKRKMTTCEELWKTRGIITTGCK